MVLSLPFIGAGSFVLMSGVHAWRESARAKHWEPVLVALHEVELDAAAGKDGNSRTYAVKARYSYDVDGKKYEGDRVGFHIGADNIGTWHQEKYAILKQAMDTDGAFNAFVNPANPGESVLFPELRVPLLLFQGAFGGIFALIGLGLFIAGAKTLFGGGLERRLARAFPSEPWRWREDWAAGVIKSDSEKNARGTMALAIVWVALSTVAFVAMAFGGNKPPLPAILLVLVFEGVGITLVVWAIRELRVAKRYGAAQLHLISTPGVIGGKLAGVVALPNYADPEDAYRVELLCERRIRSGKNTRRVKVWGAELVLDPKKLHAKRDGVQIPVLFSIPHGLPPADDSVTWTLRVRAKQPGIDVDIPFTVPVFVTAESRPDAQVDDSAIRPYLLERRPS